MSTKYYNVLWTWTKIIYLNHIFHLHGRIEQYSMSEFRWNCSNIVSGVTVDFFLLILILIFLFFDDFDWKWRDMRWHNAFSSAVRSTLKPNGLYNIHFVRYLVDRVSRKCVHIQIRPRLRTIRMTFTQYQYNIIKWQNMRIPNSR